MKESLKLVLAGLTTILALTQAHAMRWYSPSTGRWLSRDPLGEESFFRQYSSGKDELEQLRLAREALRPCYNFSLPPFLWTLCT